MYFVYVIDNNKKASAADYILIPFFSCYLSPSPLGVKIESILNLSVSHGHGRATLYDVSAIGRPRMTSWWVWSCQKTWL